MFVSSNLPAQSADPRLQFGMAPVSMPVAPASRDSVQFAGQKPLPRKLHRDSFHIPATRDLLKKLIPTTGIGAGILTVINPLIGGPVLGVWALLSLKAYRDMTQTEHSLLRTHPLIGHGRYLMEGLRPEIQQYFIEKDTDEVPLSRLQRDLVYKRSKGVNDKQAFGTLHDLYKVGTEWLTHTMAPTQGEEIAAEPRIRIGGPDCKQPYEASVFNTSGMSFGSLSPQAIMALAKGAYLDNFYVNTGEGGISPFHLGFDVNIEDPNFDFDKILDMAEKPISEDELVEARRSGARGVIEKGLIRLLPLNEEDQLEAIRTGREEHLRTRIQEKLAEVKDELLTPLGVKPDMIEQLIYESYKAVTGGHEKDLPPAMAALINPIVAHMVIEDANQQQRVVSEAEQTEINEELLTRGLGKLLRIRNPEKLKTGVPGKIIKGTAEKLRLNTMEFTRFPAGDLVWNIGTGYFGCRNPDGTFNAEKYARRARLPQVKMIELKLSQGAKPGGGGILPSDKVTPGLAKLRTVEAGKDCLSPSRHSAFSNPTEMMQFIKKLRDLSGGKPVGFKLAIGQPYEFLALCKAMRETGITPDFITVDGAEGGTGAAPATLTDHAGMPLNDALSFVHNALIGAGLRDRIKIIASGKVVDEYDIVSKVARGADLCNSARAMMLSIGCIMARLCHTNRCPVGVATQDPELTVGLDPDDKGLRNASYHRVTVKELRHLLGAAGLKSIREVTPDHIMQRIEPNRVRRLSNVLPTLRSGALLNGQLPENLPPHLEDIAEEWEAADPESFRPRPGSRMAERMQEAIDVREPKAVPVIIQPAQKDTMDVEGKDRQDPPKD